MKYFQAAASFPFVVTPIVVLLYLVAFIDLALQPDEYDGANRYVNAQTGFDNTTCINASLPCRTIGYALEQSDEDDVIGLAGAFQLTDAIHLARNITLQAMYANKPPSLACGLMNKVAIRVLGSAHLINLKISSCLETGLVIYLQNSNQMRGSFDRLEVFNNTQGIKLVQSGYYYPVFNPIRITNSIIRNNDQSNGAPINGCGIALISSVVQLLNMTIKNNLCVMGHGGGLYVGASSILLIENTTVANNVASKGGGIFSEMARLEMIATNVTANEAVEGAGMYASSTQATITDSVFADNKASGDGGAIWAYMGWTNATLTRFSNNRAAQSGGGFYGNQAGTWTVDTFWNGNAARDGGGLYTIDCTVMMTRIDLEKNVAEMKGGGANLKGSSNMFWNATMRDNLAQDGGGMYLPGSTIMIWNSTLVNNTATGFGGGFYTATSTLILYNASLEANRSPPGNTGPAVYLQGSTLVITNVTIGDNRAGQVRQDVLCLDSSPNIYEGEVPMTLPVIICLRQCDALLVFANGTQVHVCKERTKRREIGV